MDQLAIDFSAQRGIQSSYAHANEVCEGWGDIAIAYLQGYAMRNERFAGWMVTNSAELSRSVPTPANPKAWGAVIQKAARLKIIRRDGFSKDPNRHGNPVPVWQSLVYRGVL